MRNRMLMVALAGVMVGGCGEAGGAETAADAAEERVRTVNVEVGEVQPRDFEHFVRVVGTVEAERDVTLTAEEAGQVEALLAPKGALVRTGQPLVRLDDDVLRAQLDQAASQAALAEETWERQRQLWEEDSIGTEIAYLQARYNAETAKAQARVLERRLSKTVIRAPFTGILDDRMVEVGTTVAPGSPVVRILDVDTVTIVGGVPERYAADIDRGSEVGVTVDALGGRTYSGAVDFVGSAVAGDSRTFQIEVDVPNPGLGIKPGMVADVRIARQTVDSAMVVPRHAVLRRETGYVVYVAEPTSDGRYRAVARPVVPGVSREDQVVVEEGLRPGDLVVTVGQQTVAHGDILRLTNQGTVSPEEQPRTAAPGAAAENESQVRREGDASGGAG